MSIIKELFLDTTHNSITNQSFIFMSTEFLRNHETYRETTTHLIIFPCGLNIGLLKVRSYLTSTASVRLRHGLWLPLAVNVLTVQCPQGASLQSARRRPATFICLLLADGSPPPGQLSASSKHVASTLPARGPYA